MDCDFYVSKIFYSAVNKVVDSRPRSTTSM
jgi:hypothetical protein